MLSCDAWKRPLLLESRRAQLYNRPASEFWAKWNSGEQWKREGGFFWQNPGSVDGVLSSVLSFSWLSTLSFPSHALRRPPPGAEVCSRRLHSPLNPLPPLIKRVVHQTLFKPNPQRSVLQLPASTALAHTAGRSSGICLRSPYRERALERPLAAAPGQTPQR